MRPMQISPLGEERLAAQAGCSMGYCAEHQKAKGPAVRRGLIERDVVHLSGI
ncbi:hypothetical protein ACMU9U_000630 [Yersinia enterocolitica]|uniref:hypothetical protein n=1 Tax=Yersinia enterocolitica TaxID=630 RepID=UPI0028DFDBE4|nr:hypothetical protein [Yersinia enterocolitica]ELX2244033.1 hypothetical protein [Yersinia enterocolitica]HDL6872591.1 hypothetical protein [Yersinia enterocolitica]HDL6876289.1 hypothetical protein [Yersinia enterocolitica]HDL6889154.1 hypothetical protein [Yersinia enterocolitica]